MKKVVVPISVSGNATQFVVNALSEMTDGGEIAFEKGEYHFFKDGAYVGEFETSSGTDKKKHVGVPFIGVKNITLDGNGSVFVFHEGVFPFIIESSENVTLKNFTMDTFLQPYCKIDILSKSDDGIEVKIDKATTPYRIENGHLVLPREDEIFTTELKKLSLHSMITGGVRYLFAGDNDVSKENLPAPSMHTDAEDRGDTIFFRYRDISEEKCVYAVGEPVAINIEEARNRHCFFAGRSRGVTIENAVIRRGAGMGVLAVMTDDIAVRGLKTDRNFHGNHYSLTADALHFIQCSGKIEITDCDIGSFMDDVCNIHGTYCFVSEANDGEMTVKYGHEYHEGQMPYRAGDRLDIIDDKTLDIVASCEVLTTQTVPDDKFSVRLGVKYLHGLENIREGFLVENPERMPDVLVKNNRFESFPHFRISGAGKMVCEDNYMCGFIRAFYIFDLAKYWFESGRVKDLTIRGNVFDNRSKPGCGSFIDIGVSGFATDAPTIHDGIKILNNKFYGIDDYAVSACGVRNLTVSGNIEATGDGEAPLALTRVNVAESVNLIKA